MAKNEADEPELKQLQRKKPEDPEHRVNVCASDGRWRAGGPSRGSALFLPARDPRML